LAHHEDQDAALRAAGRHNASASPAPDDLVVPGARAPRRRRRRAPAEPPRHEVISMRLSADRLALLRRFRAAQAERLGRDVSIAEAAFLALEGRAPEIERHTEAHELHRDPTLALARLHARWERERSLSSAQWELLAEYVAIGASPDLPLKIDHPRVPSPAALLAVVEAFASVYAHRQSPTSAHLWSYLHGLASAGATLRPVRDPAPAPSDDALQAALAHTRRALQAPTPGDDAPANPGHALLTAIRHEGVGGGTLDRLVAPYWPALWRLAARGHWLQHDQAVRLHAAPPRPLHGPALLPPLHDGDLTITVFPSDQPGLDFHTRIEAAGRHAAIELTQFPQLAEFRALLHHPPRLWRSRFIATTPPDTDGRTTIWLRGEHHTGLALLADEWHAWGALLDHLCHDPQLHWRLHALEQEYGEHA
jgi:hypothetical protein